MDLLIPDNWIKDFLKTNANSKDFQKFLSLSGPTVDRIKGSGKDVVYEIEVTTNRSDSMSIYGVAREAATILPRYGIKASLDKVKIKSKQTISKKANYIDIKSSAELSPRSMAILIKDVTVKDSPKYIQERLKQVGERPKNNIIDISNYVMHELGQPVHVFDYDKIAGKKMIMRKSMKGETIRTLDGKNYTLPEGGITIEDGSGKLIDMPGIMGGKNSAITNETKNVLVFVQTYNPTLVRKTAMSLDKWSYAARLFEKGLDPEQVETALRRCVDLLIETSGGKAEKEIIDVYLSKPEERAIEVEYSFINKIIGVDIPRSEVRTILTSLGFKINEAKEKIKVYVPSFRINDISIPEDIVEEIARIYGYLNIPGKIMAGELPIEDSSDKFYFENRIKNLIVGLGGVEVYNISLTDRHMAGNGALKLSNPLGSDTEYLRKSLILSLTKAAEENKHWEEPFHLFEMSNVYIPRKSDLPEERIMLGGIFHGYEFRTAKGVLEVFIDKLNINKKQILDSLTPVPGTKDFYYEFSVEELAKLSKQFPTFNPLPQFPPQVEDVTLVLPFKTEVGSVIKEILSADPRVKRIELRDIYEDSYTFRIWFQDPKKTLNNQEVSSARNKILRAVNSKFGVILKE